MNDDQMIGTIRNAGGKAQEGLGSVVGDAKLRAEGIANQVTGAAQEFYGQTRDAAANAAGAATDTASSFERALRNTIETQPYTSVIVALGIGWLLGRMHRPL